MKNFHVLICLALLAACARGPVSTYTNPIVYADYSDPDVIRVGEDFWMTASSFECAPGLQILHSRNLVDWEVVNVALPEGTASYKPQDSSAILHGEGVWAPCIRYEDGKYWIFWGDPDLGIYQVHADDPLGQWSEPVCVIEGKGLIDPSPVWTPDGKVYLVHGWAKSRCGFNGVLHVSELNRECTAAISPDVQVYDGIADGNTTIEGPKFHYRDGEFVIFAPAGGVKTGWQLQLRSSSPYGPYEWKVVMHQGATDICGPHQGGWVTDGLGGDWFIHFEDRIAWGRVLHLQPLEWQPDGWCIIGKDIDGDGVGEPVAEYERPFGPSEDPQKGAFGPESLMWQWQCAGGHSTCSPFPWQDRSLRLEKITGPRYVLEGEFNAFGPAPEGIVIVGTTSFAAELYSGTLVLVRTTSEGGRTALDSLAVQSPRVALRLTIEEAESLTGRPSDLRALCRFEYKFADGEFVPLGPVVEAAPGRWIGAKAGFIGSSLR